DNAELLHELRFLERRARQGGKAVIDHPQRGHDDYSNSLAIACAKAKKASMTYGYPVGPTRRNPFGISVPRGGTADMPAPGISAPIAVGNTGTSLGWLRNDDDDYYVGAKPVR
ncbi:MAG: hypothetical protein ACTHMB_16135, partial [Candidatus Binatia bacterium]